MKQNTTLRETANYPTDLPSDDGIPLHSTEKI